MSCQPTFCILMDDPTRMRDEDEDEDDGDESLFASINTRFDVFLIGAEA